MSEYSDRRWYALHVRSRHEKSVHTQLEAKGQNSFLPLCTAPRKWADRWKVVSLPLFPGYVFCRLDAAQRASVLATSGVIDFVRIGSELAEVKGYELEAIQRATQSSLSTEPYSGLVRGDKVVMNDGPLKGMTGTLMEIRKEFRLVLSVELLCRSVLVEINPDWVVPYGKGLLLPRVFSSYSSVAR